MENEILAFRAQCDPHTRDLAIRWGARIDGYLASEGAIAQAVDRSTILVSSAAFGMDFSSLRLLLLHELAHVHQLTRRGNDPVSSLEDEAWEAAQAWAVGKPYRIRGRARRPLNALAIIQGGPRGHPSAPPWYGTHPVEPIGNKSKIVVTDSVVQRAMTLESILDAIIERNQKDVVIVCHGAPQGLAVPFVVGSSVGAESENISRLSADRVMKNKDGMNTPIIPDDGMSRQISAERIRGLRKKVNQVRDIGLDHVAFRNCDLGKSLETLEAFRLLFGAKSLSAPKLKDSYGTFTPMINRDIKAWAETRKKAGFRVWIDHGVAFGTRHAKTIAQTEYEIVCRAPDVDTFRAWVRAHIVDSLSDTLSVVYHGMEDQSVSDPTAPVIYFIRDREFVANIAYYTV
ncbi:MAG: hypothetical protein U0R19_32375 [Bryobacteraceae bacterium]